ncbi:MAG: AMP-binding protein, partial [Mariprofundaceae bacterium]|nr:AMP-binding protein [Mariprofundaceae bacterium]
MSQVLTALARYAETQPEHPALRGSRQSMDYAGLHQAVTSLATELKQHDIQVLGVMMDNGPAWVVADLAAIHAGITLIPVPHFFSPQQVAHLLGQSGMQGLLTDRPEAVRELLSAIEVPVRQQLAVQADDISLLLLDTGQAPSIPTEIAKVTFTSGSTGEPKGACLSQPVMESVAASLAAATQAHADDMHLSVLPYATLLENIGGVYAPLLAGACVCARPLVDIGLKGAAALDVRQFVTALHEAGATTCILIPQMLHALVSALEAGMPRPEQLRYIAVGGAPVSKHLLARAEALGLPLYEGYG